MSFGGAVSSMITSLKNNKRNRKNTFEKLERFQKENNDVLHFSNSSSKEELIKIKKQLKKENTLLLIKNIFYFILVTLFLNYIIRFIFY